MAANSEKVKLYALSTCSHCKRTKQFFQECKIVVDVVDVDLLTGKEREDIIEEVKKYNPSCSFPTILVGDRVIVGFNEPELREALHLS
ncbi:MAG: NrdH-redoxin [Nitrospirae bacterium GWC2_57_13]|nr:MAG: NrdH-redoxin [Nitrospirae bacterium GWC2_57_13]